nr:hypothetical protein BgiMline_032397 [Biomphalaria glabrata]
MVYKSRTNLDLVYNSLIRERSLKAYNIPRQTVDHLYRITLLQVQISGTVPVEALNTFDRKLFEAWSGFIDGCIAT